MKERPILFSGPMVRAILEGRKTMTRRVVKPDIANFLEDGWEPEKRMYETRNGDIVPASSICPHGVPGDMLWVRETWSQVVTNIPRDYGFLYRADFSADADPSQWGSKWRPSIFMPRDASRILLEITNVRVERLQDITEEDCVREGAAIMTSEEVAAFHLGSTQNAIDSFRNVWEGINGPDSWEQNPWVWVIEFKKL